MTEATIELITSMSRLMEAENELLRAGRRSELAEIAAAKLRLIAELERAMAEGSRSGSMRPDELSAHDQERWAEAVKALQAVAGDNAQLLRRQIDLSRELMDAISDEAKRQVGTRSEVYGSRGGLQRTDLPAPIAVNASL